MEDLYRIANVIFEQNDIIVEAIKDGGHSKLTLLEYIFIDYPYLSNQEAESLLSLLFARYLVDLAEATQINGCKSPMSLDALFIVSAIRKRDRGNRTLIRNSMRFLLFYYSIDFDEEDAMRLVRDLKQYISSY